ncbi:MAG: XdhC family protein [Chloroflexi bacterium]|nr:XdhC family protein [Chloroflexota bacterium]MCY3581156.1 XdhC family protein [Chloroflexota bacterium]MCY3716472.1 XdhC family protein [Chloroflexota bacterium]MDE2649481.1 XdhC family protein [Chloroflexota bacterium]MXX83446.1 XdhC family protein [Chloroflexota bacterium]
MRDILETVNGWLREDRPVALATVAKTWGSAPRREGSKLGIAAPGQADSAPAMIGSVSGGCVEGAVVEEALAGLKDGRARLLKFGVADDMAWEVGLTCGGSIEVFVEPLDATYWQLLAGLATEDRYGVALVVVAGAYIGEKMLLDAGGKTLYQSGDLPESLAAQLRAAAAETCKSGIVELDDTRVMVDQQVERPHLILVGGVHVAIPLTAMAQQVGFRVSIIDPRSAFASSERFPDVANILHSYPDKALPRLGLDGSSYLAVLTHDPKIDDKALLTALPAGIPYVGVLSSGRTHRQRVARLREAGLSETHIAQIHTPIGITIGASSPEEIAVCILAEVIAVRNGARDAIR